jgi:acetyltransferase-like isoleucine patch superfamily enzyme
MIAADERRETRAVRGEAPAPWERVAAGLARRASLVWARLRYPRARFGARIEVRRGFHLTLGRDARLTVGERCILDRDMTIECQGTLTIGDGTIFGHHCTLAARDSLVIGRDCLIAEMVAIRDHDHRFDGPLVVPVREQGHVCAPVTIGDNVWLAGKVTVLKGVTIGDNAVVGANAVVTRDIPANAVAVGVPARVIRYRG